MSQDLLYVLVKESMRRKQAAQVFPEQLENDDGSKKDIPEKVVEIANAIRRDDPKMSDEAAYRIAWDTHKGKRGGSHTGGSIPKKWSGKKDPTGIREKLSALPYPNVRAAHGPAFTPKPPKYKNIADTPIDKLTSPWHKPGWYTKAEKANK
jgi:hypothetical protein